MKTESVRYDADGLKMIGHFAFAVSTHGNRQGGVSLRFPFNAPGYLIEPVPANSGTAFDVVRCPIADYFRGQGLSIFVPRLGATSTMHLPSWLTRSLFAPRRLPVAMIGVTFD